MVKKIVNYATKDDVKKIVTEAVDAVLSGMDQMTKNFATKSDLKRVENKVDGLSVEVHYIKDEIKNIKADISVLPVH